MSINRVIISGNLTRDAELRQTASGMQVLSFGVAVNERVKNSQTQQWEDRANFVDCTMFGQRAQAVAQYMTKGAKVAIEGRLRYSTWQDNQGQKRSKLEIIVDELEFMSRQGNAQEKQPERVYGRGTQPTIQNTRQPITTSQNAGYAAQEQGYYAQPQSVSIYDEDIPF